MLKVLSDKWTKPKTIGSTNCKQDEPNIAKQRHCDCETLYCQFQKNGSSSV